MTTKTLTEADVEARIREVMGRPYRRVVQGEPHEGYLAFVPEFPGCTTAGATEAEALENLREAMAAWLESVIAEGLPVPEPAGPPSVRKSLADYSGRLLVRLPRFLHAKLLERAKNEGVSANQLVVALLAKELG